MAFCGDHRSPWIDEELERCYRAPNCHVIDDVPVINPDHPLTIEARQSSDIVTNIVASEGIVNTATCRPYDIVHGTLYNPCQNTGCSHETTIHNCPLPDIGSPKGTVVHCTITQDGSYANDGYSSRNMFVRLLEDLTAARTTNQTDRLLSTPSGGSQTPVEVNYFGYSAPASIKVTRYGKVTGSVTPVEIAHMSFSITCTGRKETDCSTLSASIAETAAGMMQGLETPLPGVTNFFGKFTGNCSQ